MNFNSFKLTVQQVECNFHIISMLDKITVLFVMQSLKLIVRLQRVEI